MGIPVGLIPTPHAMLMRSTRCAAEKGKRSLTAPPVVLKLIGPEGKPDQVTKTCLPAEIWSVPASATFHAREEAACKAIHSLTHSINSSPSG